MSIDRRMSPRWTADRTVVVEVVGQTNDLTIVDIGAGGLAVTSPRLMTLGERPRFRISDRAGRWSHEMAVRMAYCTVQPATQGPHKGKFVAGFAYRDMKKADVRQRAEQLVDLVALVPRTMTA